MALGDGGGAPPPGVIVLAGPAGVGKTTVGEALAAALGWRFLDADAFHTADAIARMTRGEPLTDHHRAPWLAALREEIGAALAAATPTVVACSALRRRYREALQPPSAPPGAVAFVLLTVTPGQLARRLSTRSGHFAPVELLASQLAALEPAAQDERVLELDGEQPVPVLVQEIRQAFRLE